ncbi:O-methyltransferase domain containing protein [Tylopilus felleus]
MSTNKAKLEALLTLINSTAQQAIAEYEKAGDDVPFIDSTELHPLDDATDSIALKNAIRTLEGACAQLCVTLAPPSHTMVNLVNVHDQACMHVLCEENITDILVNYPKGIHVNELSKILNFDPKKLVRVLRLMATRGCYNEVEPDTFANNRLSLMLRSKTPVRWLVDMNVSRNKHTSSILFHESLKDSESGHSEEPKHAPSMYEAGFGPFYEWLKREDARRESFHNSMRGFNTTMGSVAFLTQFPFDKYSTVVDVGGGIGSFSLDLVKQHKHIKVTLQDLPEALAQAREFWATEYPEAVEENRIEFSDLDFFTQAPIKGRDIYYLRAVIHNWPDNEAALILRNIRQAMGPRSRILIHDHVLLELSRKQDGTEAGSLSTVVAPQPLLPNFGVGSISAYQWDMTMWAICNAKERMLPDVLNLTGAAGLKLEKIWDLVETCVLEFSAV